MKRLTLLEYSIIGLMLLTLIGSVVIISFGSTTIIRTYDEVTYSGVWEALQLEKELNFYKTLLIRLSYGEPGLEADYVQRYNNLSTRIQTYENSISRLYALNLEERRIYDELLSAWETYNRLDVKAAPTANQARELLAQFGAMDAFGGQISQSRIRYHNNFLVEQYDVVNRIRTISLVTVSVLLLNLFGMIWIVRHRFDQKLTRAYANLKEQAAELMASRKELASANAELRDQHDQLSILNTSLIGARDAAEAANRMKTQFLSTMSHELRTPLNAVIGFSQLIPRYGQLSERQLSLLGRITYNGEHLLGLINDILDLAKIEAGRLDLLREETDLTTIIQGVAATASGLIKDTAIQFHVEIAPDMPPLLLDPVRIRQVILNLVSNAIKFTEAGSVTLRAIDHGDMISIAVIDTGIGIAPENLARVFEEFQQVHDHLNRSYEGTGLGLPIARRLVEMHGGSLTLASEVGQGSTFTIRLPKPRPETSAGVAHDAPTILIVEDDPQSMEFLQVTLEDAGYRVVGIMDSRQAQAVALEQRPAAIVLDIQMPHLNGWDVLGALKADPATMSIPVLVCSALDSGRVGQMMGASAHLSKPIEPTLLLRTVARWVNATASVLVIDDDPDARLLLSQVVAESGYAVLEARSGAEAISMLDAHHGYITLLVLDLRLLDMDGRELLAHIRTSKAWEDMPVMVVTAYDIPPGEQAELLQYDAALFQKHDIRSSVFKTTLRRLAGPVNLDLPAPDQ